MDSEYCLTYSWYSPPKDTFDSLCNKRDSQNWDRRIGYYHGTRKAIESFINGKRAQLPQFKVELIAPEPRRVAPCGPNLWPGYYEGDTEAHILGYR